LKGSAGIAEIWQFFNLKNNGRALSYTLKKIKFSSNNCVQSGPIIQPNLVAKASMVA